MWTTWAKIHNKPNQSLISNGNQEAKPKRIWTNMGIQCTELRWIKLRKPKVSKDSKLLTGERMKPQDIGNPDREWGRRWPELHQKPTLPREFSEWESTGRFGGFNRIKICFFFFGCLSIERGSLSCSLSLLILFSNFDEDEILRKW